VLHKLGNLYKNMNLAEKAQVCFEENIARMEKDDKVNNPETAEAILFLARYYKERCVCVCINS
jgi:hypothetical protein